MNLAASLSDLFAEDQPESLLGGEQSKRLLNI